MKISKELTSGKGLYVGAYLSPESVAVLRKWCDEQGIPHNVDDSHITVIYSKSLDVEMEGTIDALTDRMDDLNDISITPTGLKYLGKNNECLVLSVEVSGDIMELRQIAMDGGFEPTYAEYQPHVTLFDGMEKEIDYTFSNLPDTLECDRFEVKNLDEDKFESTIDQRLDRLMARRGETPEQFNKAISRGLAQLEDLQLTHGREYQFDTLYHISLKKNLDSILKNGLIPSRMNWWKETRQACVHAIVNKSDLESSVNMVDENGDPENVVVFKINASKYRWTGDPTMTGLGELDDPSFVITDSTIDPSDLTQMGSLNEELNYDNVPDHLWRDMPIGDFKKQIQSDMPDQKIYYDTDIPETIRALWYNRDTQDWVLVGVYDQQENLAAIDTSNTVTIPKKSGGLRSLFYQNENRDPKSVDSSSALKSENNMSKKTEGGTNPNDGDVGYFITGRAASRDRGDGQPDTGLRRLSYFSAVDPVADKDKIDSYLSVPGRTLTYGTFRNYGGGKMGVEKMVDPNGVDTSEFTPNDRNYTAESVVKLVEADVARSKAILAVGDFIKTGQPGSAEVLERVESLLKINGLAGASFEDAYVALQALNDDDLNSIYDFALGRGMDDLAGKKDEE